MIVRRIFATTTAVVSVAGIVTACSSVPDITFDDDAGAPPDATTGLDGASKDAATDAAADAPKDAPADVPACTPSNGGIEDCDDGLDNDCNGKIDCADPACTPTHACIDTPPIGWSLLGEADTTRPTCPPAYPTVKDIEVVAGTGAGTCACTCAPTVPTEACNLQSSKVTVSGKSACNDPTNDVSESVGAAQAACTTLTTSLKVPTAQGYGVTTAPPVPPSGCTPTVTNDAPPITAGRTCAPATTPSFGGGCGVGKVCALKVPAGLTLCIAKTGAANVCPGTYATRKTAGAATVDGGVPDGGATTDGRTCHACSCNQPACTSTVTLYENADCSGKTSGALPGVCTATTDKNFTALAYKSTTTGTGCGLGSFDNTTTGSIAFTDPTTICCP